MMAVVNTPRADGNVVVDFQTIPELQQFVVANVRPTGKELGRGAYGTVEEVEIPGAICAAKIIHEALLHMGNEDEVSAWLIYYLHYLIVVGGVDCAEKYTTNVEILDTSRSQWYNAEPLPEPCVLQQSTRILDTLYFLGSSPSMPVFQQPSSPSHFFRASISTLISIATSKCEAATPIWEKLPDTPFLCAGLVAYDNSLLAIGGFNAQNIPGIHAYNPDTNEWTNIGSLPTALHVSMSVVLPSKEFLVVTSHKEVYIGTPSSV